MCRKACVLGATGLVGSKLLSLLIDDPYYTSINIITRRKISLEAKNIIQYIADFNTIETFANAFAVDDIYCCLGTTMKKAGSKEAFKQVDYHYVAKAAQLAYSQGAKQFLVVSAVGANPHSLFFYNRIKGLMEKDVASIPFEAVHIFRPSLLLGQREESRFLEDIAQRCAKPFSYILKGPLRKYAPVDAMHVAHSMIHAAKTHTNGVHIHEAF
ncbi:MAG: oxidoreductase [Spirochaetes bacterium]|nr:oxidoreductase [Spirochaetota bacterium]